jgi:hypothetical protein
LKLPDSLRLPEKIGDCLIPEGAVTDITAELHDRKPVGSPFVSVKIHG